MRSYILNVAFDMTAVVPDAFIEKMRAEAKLDHPDTTPFLQDADKRFAGDDEGFGLHLTKHALRRIVRNAVANEFALVGIGGRFAPLVLQDRTPPHDAKPALASEVAAQVPDRFASPRAVALGGEVYQRSIPDQAADSDAHARP